MLIVLVLVGISWILAGVLFFIFTDATREIIKNVAKQKNFKSFSILPLVVGLLLILGAPSVTSPWFVILLGLLGTAKGLFLMFGPKSMINAMTNWCLSVPDRVLKTCGIMTFLLGIALLLMI